MKKNAFVIVLYLAALASFAVVCFLAVYYVPKYKEIFSNLNVDLPGISIYSLMLSDSVLANFLTVIVSVVVITSLVWTLPSRGLRATGFCFVVLVNVLLGTVLYGGVQLVTSRLQPACILAYEIEQSTTAYQAVVAEAKSPQFIEDLQETPSFLTVGILAVAEANNENAVEFIETTLEEQIWSQSEFSKNLDDAQWRIFAASVYALYKIQGKYPQQLSKKIEVFDHSSKFLPAVRFMCRDESALYEFLKYYTADLPSQLATWSPQVVEKDAQPQVDFKDVSAHEILKYIRLAVYMLPKY